MVVVVVVVVDKRVFIASFMTGCWTRLSVVVGYILPFPPYLNTVGARGVTEVVPLSSKDSGSVPTHDRDILLGPIRLVRLGNFVNSEKGITRHKSKQRLY
jgi:hypothetical protein